MKDNYSFPGEVTMSIEEYNDIISELNKAQRDAEMYLQAYKSVNEKYQELVKETEDKF